ncbi:lipoamide acyltransferase component of branched-chain alpha-keto acid dehydrogenase complex, mitochondrial [Polistes fuscatus]|uniref:lipoamide acyltransferase component of branched-chain alpha-keto acid dehydrogenase complex, mitochondrial n=1 Tax=Polistes fuscatus TaxID=30207 RepID=UPI001CA9B60B|nr:lipoamide acyltransferase component of branched-chain alpha-keto acid dehydrogenase complex, mitochondrial [Polistes fuscatus]
MAFILRLGSSILRLSKNGCTSKRRFLSLSSLRSGTIVPFKLSDIGEGIRDVTVKEWFVKPGDRVSQFDNICEVQSDKASVTITSRYDGLVKELHYKIDEIALVGEPLIDIELDEENTVENEQERKIEENREKEEEAKEKEKVKAEEKEEVKDNKKFKEKNDKTSLESSKDEYPEKIQIIATPAVRRLALENNINLCDVRATGKDGRVLKEDVLVYLEKLESKKQIQEVTQQTERKMPIKKYSKHMWKTMTQSLSIPHFVYSDECNVTELIRCRNEVKDSLKEQGISLSLMPFLIKAASKALQKIPELNGLLDEEKQLVEISERHNIGVAMDTPGGLIVPNIKDVQNLSILSIAKQLNRLQELGKKASIPLADLTGTTFSLSNIGVIGGNYTKPVIQPPQIVIGAFGKVQKLPRFDDKDNVIAANIIAISWAADHRVIDGVTMAKYSNLWKYYVEHPIELMLDS